MKRSIKSFAKEASNLYQSIHQQLSVYALAGVVAVVSVLALAPLSEAKIVYTPANVVIENSTYNLDLNDDGIVDFSIPEINSDSAHCPQGGGFLSSWAQHRCEATESWGALVSLSLVFIPLPPLR